VDWFSALESPTQVAIGGVVTAFIGAAATVVVTILKNRQDGGGKAEIAAMTIDSSSVKQVAAALEALNVTLMGQNKIAEEGGGEMGDGLKAVARELEEVRRELRAVSDKMRARD
jgi:hypothetical protein